MLPVDIDIDVDIDELSIFTATLMHPFPITLGKIKRQQNNTPNLFPLNPFSFIKIIAKKNIH